MTEKVAISIAEDDFIIAQDIKLSLEHLGYVVLNIFESGEAFLQSLEQQKPDLVLLDINLEGKIDGIAVARLLNEKYGLPFIYLTAQSDKATLDRVKTTEPQAFLLKPFNINELQASIEIAMFKFSKQQAQKQNKINAAEPKTEGFLLNQSLFIKVKNRIEKVQLNDILWLEAKDIYSVIKTRKNQYVVSHPLKTFESLLPENDFIRIHRSYMVALDAIDAIEDNNLLIATQYIPIGKTYKESLLKKLRII